MTSAASKKPAAKAANGPADEIATIRIELADTKPSIWRQVEVPTAITLKSLHDVIQAAMGWFNQHLWEFTIGKRRYGPPGGEGGWDPDRSADAAKVRLLDVIKPGRTTIDYIYDFGDSWAHRLIVSNLRAGQPGVLYPRYVGGERAAPPEDCGGLPGFYNCLDALADPKHPEHAELVEWLGGYDPNTFDDRPIALVLGRMAARRSAVRKRTAKPPGD